MVNHAVHWAEGLFLQPHHFQALERRLRDEIQHSENWYHGYTYGLRKIEIDYDALKNWRIVLKSCSARFRDGSHIATPEDGNLNPILIPKNVFDRQDNVLVYLAISRLQLGRKNADVAGTDSNSRYLVEPIELEDENDPGNPQSLMVRWPNVKLLLGTQDISGFETLPIMRLRRGAMVESPVEIDTDYIPPVLACDSETWGQLSDIISGIYNYVSGQVTRLSKLILDRGIAFESGHREDLERLFRLHSLNGALGMLTPLAFARGIHPFVAYMELSRSLGTISIFRPDRKLPAIPYYDHDNLGLCFHALRRFLLEETEQEAEPIKRPFVGSGLQLQVKLDREWLGPGWTFYLGVDSTLGFDRIVSLMIGGHLDMKVGSTRRVDQIFRNAWEGVELIAEREAPRVLPGKTWTYWRVKQDSTAWKDVEETLNLGVRIPDRQIRGRIEGLEQIRVVADNGQETEISLALFAIPPGVAQ